MVWRSSRWVYIGPLVHLLLCVTALSGYVFSPLAPLGILISFLDVIDFPISLIYMGVGMIPGPIAGFIALMSLFCAGTLWWYLLCRVIEKWTLNPEKRAGNIVPP
jgi:hypothetical protein